MKSCPSLGPVSKSALCRFQLTGRFDGYNYHLPVRVEVGSALTAGRAAQASAHEIIAPHKTELLDVKSSVTFGIARVAWRYFRSFPRFPKNARSVQGSNDEC